MKKHCVEDEDSSFLPDWASPPGDTILSLLEEKGISQEALASHLGFTQSRLEQLLSGELAIADDIALVLRDCLGGTYTFWIKREGNYRAALERITCHK